MKIPFLPALAVCFALGLFASNLAAAPPLENHAILISCDGLRPDAVEKLGEERLPNLFRMIKEGVSTKNARTDKTQTVTLPNHTSMVTGRPVAGAAGHNWTSNGTPKLGEMLHRKKKQYVRSMFGVAHDHGMRTALFSSKTKFLLYDRSYDERNGKPDTIGEDNGKDKLDVFVFEEDIEKLMPRYLEAMKATPFQLSMLHLRDTDTAGHASGWDLTDGAPYMKAVVRIDGVLGQLMELIDSDDRFKGKTSIILTADHGGRMETKTHLKADSPYNYTIPFVVWGPTTKKGGDLYALNAASRKDPGTENPAYDSEGLAPIRNGDAGNLALSLLDLPAIGGSSINAKQDLKVAEQVSE
ncbi:MAG: putative AlkP superfamily pyrophosphatase or phosphodiesterase [Verrucomicrobiales bacterium]|jgi:predicted AlkP superfamily pyrophosphatase or phosphodiesterase